MKKQILNLSHFLSAHPYRFKWVLFLLLSLLLSYKAFLKTEPYITGDGMEYVAMTEAIYLHGSPEFRISDFENLKKDWIESGTWETNIKAHEINGIIDCLKNNQKSFMSSCYSGFFQDKFGQTYSYHFFFYSIFNVPVRFALHLTKTTPIMAFQITNVIFILLTCALLLFYKPFPFWYALGTTLSFVFSATYWYIGWTHPEVFCMCLVTASLWLAYRGNHYSGIVLAIFATLQNQPLALLVGVLALNTLYQEGFTIKNLTKLFLLCTATLLPSLFYYYHFNTPNLISTLGFLDPSVVTFNRVWGFFFDLNQGALLAIPILLPVFLFFWFTKITSFIKRKKNENLFILIPIALIAISISVSTMTNWNHGHAVINRYASWTSSILLILFFIWLFESNLKNQQKTIVLFLISVSQLLAITYFDKKNKYDWGAGANKPYVEWIYSHCPSVYNPDFTIFIARVKGGNTLAKNQMPIPYYNENNQITKLLVNKKYIQNITKVGLKDEAVDYYSSSLNFTNDWGYINDPEKFIDRNKEKSYIDFVENEKINQIMQDIRINKGWLELIKIKASEQNIPLDSAIKNDAIYCAKNFY